MLKDDEKRGAYDRGEDIAQMVRGLSFVPALELAATCCAVLFCSGPLLATARSQCLLVTSLVWDCCSPRRKHPEPHRAAAAAVAADSTTSTKAAAAGRLPSPCSAAAAAASVLEILLLRLMLWASCSF